MTKRTNNYQEQLSGKLYADCPKSVFAAIAVSAITSGGAYIDEAQERILREWWVLYRNGIVQQKPTLPYPGESV